MVPAPRITLVGTDAAQITGGTAAEIAESIRGLVERGRLAPGAALPPVRALAEQLGINLSLIHISEPTRPAA